jgi:uncharacterized protein (TIGR03437 family)
MTIKCVLIACLAALPVLAQYTGVYQPVSIYLVHSATRRTAQTPATGLAPGSLCDINVTGLYQMFGGSLSQDDAVTMRIRVPGATDARDLTIVAEQARYQFTALIPPDALPGKAEVLAVAAGGKSFTTTVWIAGSGFGVFTKTGAGYDAAAAQVLRDPPRTVGLTTPVLAGEWVTLWGTGLGQNVSNVSVDVAGIGVAPAYAGPAPGLPGVDQVNFRFPAGVPGDCYVPLTVIADGHASNTTSIAAADAAGACHHRLGLSQDALASLDSGGQVAVSQNWVHSDVIPNPDGPIAYRRYDTVSLDFMQRDAARVQVATGLIGTKVAGCQLNIGGDPIGMVALWPPFDAGTVIATGPGGVRLLMGGIFGYYSSALSQTSYSLDTLPPSLFGPGDWAVEASGGTNVAAFRAALRIPPPLRWTNRASVSPVSRSNDLTLRWDPAGYTSQEWMQGSIGVGVGAVICQAPATAGAITIPASLIAQLPEPTNIKPTAQLLLTPDNSNPLLYSAPLVGGGTIPGVATFSFLEVVQVELK